jgi:hypothetical protein
LGASKPTRLHQARAALAPVLARLGEIAAALAPYEQIKADLAAARARYRELIQFFVAELKATCDAMGADEKRELVLELFAQDVRGGMDGAMGERLGELVQFVERVWEKYRVTLMNLRCTRQSTEERLNLALRSLAYS